MRNKLFVKERSLALQPLVHLNEMYPNLMQFNSADLSGELLARLKNDTLRQEFVEQMKMNGQQLPRIKVKLLGPSGVGKSALIDSLKCGYFSSWFRSRSSPPTKTGPNGQQVECSRWIDVGRAAGSIM